MSVVKYDLMNRNFALPVESVVSSMNAALQESNATSQALVNYFGNKVIFKATNVIPFSSDRKFSAVTFNNNETFIIGAPEFVLKSNFEKYSSIITDYANKGLRVICLAQAVDGLKDNKIHKAPKLIALILALICIFTLITT